MIKIDHGYWNAPTSVSYEPIDGIFLKPCEQRPYPFNCGDGFGSQKRVVTSIRSFWLAGDTKEDLAEEFDLPIEIINLICWECDEPKWWKDYK